MEFLKLYRGVADVCPVNIQTYYKASYDKKYLAHGEHTAGDGMYFAFNKSDAQQYLKIRRIKFYGIVGTFVVKGNYKVYDNLLPSDDDVKITQLQELLKKSELVRDRLFCEKYGPKILENEDFILLSLEEINKIMTPHEEAFKKKQKENGFNAEQNEIDTVKVVKVINSIKEKINQLRIELKYDLSIHEYEEVCIHNPQVNIEMNCFDVIFNDEQEAKSLFEDLKVGELDKNQVLGIEGSAAEIVSKWLSQKSS